MDFEQFYFSTKKKLKFDEKLVNSTHFTSAKPTIFKILEDSKSKVNDEVKPFLIDTKLEELKNKLNKPETEKRLINFDAIAIYDENSFEDFCVTEHVLNNCWTKKNIVDRKELTSQTSRTPQRKTTKTPQRKNIENKPTANTKKFAQAIFKPQDGETNKNFLNKKRPKLGNLPEPKKPLWNQGNIYKKTKSSTNFENELKGINRRIEKIALTPCINLGKDISHCKKSFYVKRTNKSKLPQKEDLTRSKSPLLNKPISLKEKSKNIVSIKHNFNFKKANNLGKN
jgi:hypothetical protein